MESRSLHMERRCRLQQPGHLRSRNSIRRQGPEPGGVPITNTSSAERLPDVAANTGTTRSLLVTWDKTIFYLTDRGQLATDRNIQARRTTPQGVPLGTAPLDLTNAVSREQEDPAVASDGTDFFVVWEDGDDLGAGKDIKGGRVTGSGARIGAANGFTISGAVDAQTDAAVAYNGNYLVVWADRRAAVDWDIFGNQVSRGGGVKNGTGFELGVEVGRDEDSPAVWHLRCRHSSWSGGVPRRRRTRLPSVPDGSGVRTGIQVAFRRDDGRFEVIVNCHCGFLWRAGHWEDDGLGRRPPGGPQAWPRRTRWSSHPSRTAPIPIAIGTV